MCYMVKTMETEQFNIRISKELSKDLDTISDILKVNKSEWVRTKIAQEVHEEKNKLLMELSTLFSRGMINKKDVESLVGQKIAQEMESSIEIARKSIKSGADYGRKLKRKVHN